MLLAVRLGIFYVKVILMVVSRAVSTTLHLSQGRFRNFEHRHILCCLGVGPPCSTNSTDQNSHWFRVSIMYGSFQWIQTWFSAYSALRLRALLISYSQTPSLTHELYQLVPRYPEYSNHCGRTWFDIAFRYPALKDGRQSAKTWASIHRRLISNLLVSMLLLGHVIA